MEPRCRSRRPPRRSSAGRVRSRRRDKGWAELPPSPTQPPVSRTPHRELRDTPPLRVVAAALRRVDDLLEALVALILAKGWELTGVDLDQLETDIEAQRAERIEHDAAQSGFLALHERFAQAQDARYQRFATALAVARSVFRNDKAVLAELERFKRVAKRAKKTPAEEAA